MKANKTITFFIFLFSFFIWSCDNESNNSTTAIDRDYTLTLLGKTVTVTDTRTGAADKSLEAMGVMEKLRGGVALINANTNMQTETREAYDRVLAKGLVIIIEKPAVAYEGYKAKDDGKTLLFDIDHITDDECRNGSMANYINNGIVEYLDKGLDFE